MPTHPSDSRIGFPPPYLGPRPCRLQVLRDLGDLLIVEKPAGVLATAHDWYPRLPDVAGAINQQAAKGKPELQRLGISKVWSVFGIDPEISGAVLLARSESAAMFYRNQYGSRKLSLVFSFFSRNFNGRAEFRCELPLARHNTRPQLVVSRRRGKKATTVFSLREEFEGFSRWDVTTDFCRLHQIRVHAAESGVPGIGERLYAKSARVFLSELKPDYRERPDKPERPLHAGYCAYLRQVMFSGTSGEEVVVDVSMPRSLQVMYRRIRQHRGNKSENMLYSEG